MWLLEFADAASVALTSQLLRRHVLISDCRKLKKNCMLRMASKVTIFMLNVTETCQIFSNLYKRRAYKMKCLPYGRYFCARNQRMQSTDAMAAVLTHSLLCWGPYYEYSRRELLVPRRCSKTDEMPLHCLH